MSDYRALARAMSMGQREDNTPKGFGFYGALPRPEGGYSSELSASAPVFGKETLFPLIAPGLSPQQLNWLQTNEPNPQAIPHDILINAMRSAAERIRAGKSPFKQMHEP